MKNKIALVVGAGDNLGSAICKCFSNEGFIVVACRRNGDKLVTLKNEIETSGGIFYGHSLDARKEEDVIEFIKNTEKNTGLPATDVIRYGGEKIFNQLI